jgi:hypothetical protein
MNIYNKKREYNCILSIPDNFVEYEFSYKTYNLDLKQLKLLLIDKLQYIYYARYHNIEIIDKWLCKTAFGKTIDENQLDDIISEPTHNDNYILILNMIENIDDQLQINIDHRNLTIYLSFKC